MAKKKPIILVERRFRPREPGNPDSGRRENRGKKKHNMDNRRTPDGGDKMAKAKKGGGGKLSRSETVTVRLDPKLRFAAELAARKHRRTLSSFIEWAVEEAIQSVDLGNGETAYHAMNNIWDVDEPDRFVKLALNYPNLLTHEEERLWKLICGCGIDRRPPGNKERRFKKSSKGE